MNPPFSPLSPPPRAPPPPSASPRGNTGKQSAVPLGNTQHYGPHTPLPPRWASTRRSPRHLPGSAAFRRVCERRSAVGGAACCRRDPGLARPRAFLCRMRCTQRIHSGSGKDASFWHAYRCMMGFILDDSENSYDLYVNTLGCIR